MYDITSLKKTSKGHVTSKQHVTYPSRYQLSTLTEAAQQQLTEGSNQLFHSV
jgi:hypothetical protein